MVPFLHDNPAAGIAIRYGLDGPGIKPRGERNLQHQSTPALGPIQPPITWVQGYPRG